MTPLALTAGETETPERRTPTTAQVLTQRAGFILSCAAGRPIARSSFWSSNL
jgi:hypothetical protein